MNIKKIYKYLYLILLINIFNQKVFSTESYDEPKVNYDIPIQKKEFNMGKNEYGDADLIRTCYQYSDSILVEINDKGNKGGALIGIEPSNNKTNFLNTCKKDYSKFKIKMTADGYFGGKINHYIINNGDDGYGAQYLFQINKINNDKIIPVYEDIRHSMKNYKYIRNPNHKLGVRYWKNLKADFDCSVYEKNCLEKIKISNKIPVNLNYTDCLKTIKEEIKRLKKYSVDPSSLNTLSGNHFFIYIEVPDIEKAEKYKILSNKIACSYIP
ncbi:hypothetical protein [Silvanigrella sp.]|uniref:hypothetical protein n=1 Tax=Silvanigrella sp. TaxID=2024976 RepID=UPI0037CAA640